MQPMSCDHAPAVHRTVDLPAAPEVVWEAIVAGAWLGVDPDGTARPGIDAKVGVVDARCGSVALELLRVGDVTRLWVREVRLDLDVTSMVGRPSALARV